MNWIEAIRSYSPSNEQEKKDKELILKCIESFGDVLTRKNTVAHMTSSAFVVNHTRDKVLMVYHNIYDSWSWTGGHADGDTNLLAVAVKEAKEETGVDNITPLVSEIFSLDVLPVIGHIKKGEYVSAHLHLTASYLLEADEEAALFVKEDENSAVKWIAMDQMNEYVSESHMKKVYDKMIMKTRALKKTGVEVNWTNR